MAKFQLQDRDGVVVGEESFDDFDAASVWAQTHEEADDGWVLLQQIAGDWVPAQKDPLPAD